MRFARRAESCAFSFAAVPESARSGNFTLAARGKRVAQNGVLFSPFRPPYRFYGFYPYRVGVAGEPVAAACYISVAAPRLVAAAPERVQFPSVYFKGYVRRNIGGFSSVRSRRSCAISSSQRSSPPIRPRSFQKLRFQWAFPPRRAIWSLCRRSARRRWRRDIFRKRRAGG